MNNATQTNEAQNMTDALRNAAGQVWIENKGWHNVIESTDMKSIHGAPYRTLVTRSPKGRKSWLVIESNGNAKAIG